MIDDHSKPCASPSRYANSGDSRTS
jgi:hypothetical protein